MNILKDLELKTGEAIKYFKEQLSAIRGGRPNSKLVEDVSVEYFGQKLPIKQLGSISIVPPREIQISVWDKNAAAIILKAIEASNLNIGANLEGSLIRINLPALSGERRQELIKIAKKETEEAKIKIRGIRDEINKEINRQFEEKKIGEDEKFKLKEQVQENIDKVNALAAKTWIMKTTHNLCIDFLRKRATAFNRESEINEEFEESFAATESTHNPYLTTHFKMMASKVKEAIQRLPENLRSVFVLYEINGLKYKEIAKTLEMPENSVKVYLMRARKKLQEELKNYEPQEVV
jgi:ribosome recycling factor